MADLVFSEPDGTVPSKDNWREERREGLNWRHVSSVDRVISDEDSRRLGHE